LSLANIKVLFWFDVEDYITPKSEDALLGLLNLCDERGIKGIFKIVGEKARTLKEHGRTDILEKLKKHEVGYHTDLHSQHPTLSEYLEPMGFREGAHEFERRELAGLNDVVEITGKPIQCYGQPGGAWAPHSFAVLKKWGIPVYLDNHPQVTLNDKPYWYGGLLNFMELTGYMRMELEEGGLEKAKKQFDQVYDQLSAEPVGFVSIVYHPCEFSSVGFWDDYNFGQGKNTPREQWTPAPLRPEGEMEQYLAMLGEFLDYTLSKDHVEYITSAEAFQLERSAKEALEREDVRMLAGRVGNELSYQIYNQYSLSASDLHSLFCKYLLGQSLTTELIYGPENGVDSDPVSIVKVADVKKAISGEYPRIYSDKQLPDDFNVQGFRINPADLTCTLAKIIADGLDDEDYVHVVRGILRSEIHAKDDDYWGNGWSIFPRDLRVPNIVKMSKLQTWTLKPALF
jgi:hypothetical protein